MCSSQHFQLGPIWVKYGLKWATYEGPMWAIWAILFAPYGAHSDFVLGVGIGPKWACPMGCWWALRGYPMGTLIGLSLCGV